MENKNKLNMVKKKTFDSPLQQNIFVQSYIKDHTDYLTNNKKKKQVLKKKKKNQGENENFIFSNNQYV